MPRKGNGGPSEHEIQSQILDWLERKRIFHYRQNSGGMKKGNHFIKFGKKGAPDIVVVIKGVYIGIEVKAQNGFQSQEQVKFQVGLEAAGGRYILAYSLEAVKRVLE